MTVNGSVKPVLDIYSLYIWGDGLFEVNGDVSPGSGANNICLNGNIKLHCTGTLSGTVNGGAVINDPFVTGVTVDSQTATLNVTETLTLKAEVTPDNAYDKTVNWSSSDTNVATVDSTGKVTAVGQGQATITATAVNCKENNITASCVVNVNAPKYTVTFESNGGSTVASQTITVGGMVTEPTAPTKKDCTFDGWYKEADFQTVWNFGTDTVTADTTLYAKWIADVTGVTLNKPTLTLTEGDSDTLIATVKPDDAGNKTVTWKSDDTSIATVDGNGKVTAVAKGQTTITVTTTDGGKTATCAITVNASEESGGGSSGSGSGSTGGSSNSGGNQENNSQSNKPIKPTEQPKPTQPATPTEPTNPVEPVKSQKPAQPTKPVDEKDEEEPFIKGDDGKEGWDVITDRTKDTTEGDKVTVDMNGATTVPGNVIESIAGKDVTVVFDMGDGITWSINGLSVTTDNIADINFNVSKNTSDIPVDVINNVTGERYSMTISIDYDGDFGFTAVLTINMEKKNTGLYANLFYYNEADGELEFICADEIDAEGNADLEFTHASDYTIVIDKAPMDELTEEADEQEKAEGETTQSTESEVLNADEESDSQGVLGWILVIVGVVVLAGVGVYLYYQNKQKEEEESEIRKE